jgi:ATP-binding cassette, subfamily B, bacterial PglK
MNRAFDGNTHIKSVSILYLLFKLWRSLNVVRRYQIGLLLVLMLLASFAEILSIGAVIPFLSLLTAPEKAFSFPPIHSMALHLGVNSPEQLFLPLTLVFGGAAILAGSVRLALLWANSKFAFAVGSDISLAIYRESLYQPYLIHSEKNSSQIIAGISGKSDSVIFGIIIPLLTLISSFFLGMAIFVTLVVIDTQVALLSFGGFGIIYAVIIMFSRNRLLADSRVIASESTRIIKLLQEGLGGIRDLIINGAQEIYLGIFKEADNRLRAAQGRSTFINQSPRYCMEALGMTLIAFLAYFSLRNSLGLGNIVPVLGAMALGAQRLLPILQQSYSSWATICANQASLDDVVGLLSDPLSPKKNYTNRVQLPFKQEIQLQNVCFRYPGSDHWAIHDLNMVIKKGSRVGIIGPTGSGKSTFLDLLMGLLQPSVGSLIVDRVHIGENECGGWQAHIAHVPQSIFLADASVIENIAFGVPSSDIDFDKVRKAASQAQLSASIEVWPDKYKTIVGERGIRLSGGQRQRIGIARALYKEAGIIIFDEATSALDNDTERALIASLSELNPDLTIFMVAHRLTTLSNCTQVFELVAGSISRSGSYEEIVVG